MAGNIQPHFSGLTGNRSGAPDQFRATEQFFESVPFDHDSQVFTDGHPPPERLGLDLPAEGFDSIIHGPWVDGLRGLCRTGQ